MNCTHTQVRHEYVEVEHPITGEVSGEYQPITESGYEDIDLHRYRCRLCGHIGYYSGAARAFYEQGIKSPGIRGLE